MNDELKFIKKIIKDVKNENSFLYAADSKNIIKQHYNKAVEYAKDKDNLLLITSEDKLKITDASEQFKNKCVFYSPSIVSGIDFNSDKPQNVYQYIKGNTLNPILLYQQLTRTRNIKKVYQFINTPNITMDKKERNYHSKYAKYKNIDECRQFFEKLSLTYSNTYNNNEHYKIKQGEIKQYHPILLSMFINVIDDEIQFNYNAFYKIFTYNEYIIDTLNTNKKAQLKYILRNSGFIIQDEGKHIDNIPTKLKYQLIDESKLIREQQLKDHIEIRDDNSKQIEDTKYNENIEAVLSYLKINNIEDAEEYKDIILNTEDMKYFNNFIKLMKTDDFIIKKINKEAVNLPEYKAVKTINYKIMLLIELERVMNIKRFEINYIKDDKPLTIDRNIIFRIEQAFEMKRSSKENESLITYNDHVKFYLNRLRSLTSNLEIIDSKRTQINKKRIQHYNIDNKNLFKYLKLYLLMDNNLKNIQVDNTIIFNDIIKPKIDELQTKYEKNTKMVIDNDFLDIDF